MSDVVPRTQALHLGEAGVQALGNRLVALGEKHCLVPSSGEVTQESGLFDCGRSALGRDGTEKERIERRELTGGCP
eukprot:11949176-Heterocapsa_arctica.AAC.1